MPSGSHKTRLSSSPLAAPETLAQQLAAEIQDYLHFPDPGPLYVMLGALVANMIKGPPVWLMLVGPPSCQPAGSQVLMSDGSWKNVEDIRVGDRVISPQHDGSSLVAMVTETVTGYDQPLFEVATRERTLKPRKYVCSGNHVVPFQAMVKKYVTGSGRGSPKKWQPTQLHELPAEKLAVRGHRFLDRVKIFTTPAVEFPRQKYAVDPYVAGVLLGDGCMTSGNLRVTNTSDDLFKHLWRLGVKFGKNTERSNQSNLQTRNVLNPAAKVIRELECYGHEAKAKFVPEEYKRGSVAQRLDLLAGLIDTDGSQTTFSSSSQQLAIDFVYLVHSVGGSASFNSRLTRCNGKTFQSFRVYYSFGAHRPTLILKHKDQKKMTKRNVRHRAIRISKAGHGDVYGFRLDSPSQWYVTDDWLVTHNSGKTAMLLGLTGISGVHQLEDITGPGALLSGIAQKDLEQGATGGLLRKTGSRGCLVMEDFTSSIMNLRRDVRQQILNAFRAIHKGRWSRDVGTGGHHTLVWEGKLAMLAGGTHAIDRQNDQGALGERWVYYRMPDTSGWGESRVSIQDPDPSASAKSLRQTIKAFMEVLDLRWPCWLEGDFQCDVKHRHFEEEERRKFTEQEYTRLIGMASVTARLRGEVYRHPYTRAVEDIAKPELPPRLANSFGQLYLGLEKIGIGEKERWKLVSKVAMDSAPEMRGWVLRACWQAKQREIAGAETTDQGGVPMAGITGEILKVSRDTAYRVVEELQLHGLVEKDKAGLVRLTGDTAEQLKNYFLM